MGKERYERPILVKHVSGLANKFGRTRSSKTMSEIDGVSVRQIAAQYGSPVFVFSEKTIKRNYRDAFRSFSIRYPKVQFAWSYKTNYLDAVCKTFHKEGSWAEVVSEFEYEMARRNGVPGNKIIYNGPYKPYDALKKAIEENANIHADHFEELYMIEQIAEELGKPVEIALRLNMDTGIYPVWDRFGFNYDNGEALEAVRRMHAGGKLRLKGVHAHIGTFILDPNAYKKETEKLIAFMKTVEAETGFSISYIDIGGGFPSNNTLHEQYAPGEETNPSIDAYAEAIAGALLSAGFTAEKLPTLILETGRALIDNAGYAVTSVVANKRLANGTRSIIIDAGVNMLFTAFWYKHNIYPVDEKAGIFEETVIYGPLCMNIDVIRPSLRLPSLEKGDLLVVAPVGAYNVTQWMQFIRMRPNVVMISETGTVSLIRKEESVETLKQQELTPDWVKN